MYTAAIQKGDKFEVEVCYFTGIRVVGQVTYTDGERVMLRIGNNVKQIKCLVGDLKHRTHENEIGAIVFDGFPQQEIVRRCIAFGISLKQVGRQLKTTLGREVKI